MKSALFQSWKTRSLYASSVFYPLGDFQPSPPAFSQSFATSSLRPSQALVFSGLASFNSATCLLQSSSPYNLNLLSFRFINNFCWFIFFLYFSSVHYILFNLFIIFKLLLHRLILYYMLFICDYCYFFLRKNIFQISFYILFIIG